MHPTLRIQVDFSQDRSLATVRIGNAIPHVCGVLGIEQTANAQPLIYLDRRIHPRAKHHCNTECWTLRGAISTILEGKAGNPASTVAASAGPTPQTLVSKGLAAPKASSLADLHRRRTQSEGQFFTPRWIAHGIWSMLKPNLNATDTPFPIIDTSIGNGRLIEPIDCANTHIYGLDTDARCIAALNRTASLPDQLRRFDTGRFEDLSLNGFAIAIINPPYSLTIASPLMRPYPCTAFGPFGPHTSALSHVYALEQALDGASVVAAILPQGLRTDDPRLAAVLTLPSNAFEEEGARVRTQILVFDREPRQAPPLHADIKPDQPWPHLTLDPRPRGPTTFKLDHIDTSAPTITTVVTGHRAVGLHHHGRRAVLTFACGLTEAKVRNALLGEDLASIKHHRYPQGVHHTGALKLHLDTWLMQHDPDQAFETILEQIRAAGGIPEISPTLAGYWRSLKRRHHRAITPMRRQIRRSTTENLRLKATRASLLRPGDLQSPPIPKGAIVEAQPLGGEYRIHYQGQTVTERCELALRRFAPLDANQPTEPAATQWTVLHEGLAKHFPRLAEQARARIRHAHIDWLWPFQEDSLVELMLKPYGAVAAWEQACGKARLAIALALLGGRASLIVVESGLVPEMIKEIEKIGLDPALWQVLDPRRDAAVPTLRQVNITSYHRLRRRIRPRRSFAQTLRRRLHTVVADEGGILANPKSHQSRALAALEPKKLIVSDGTPIPNFCRDLLPILVASAGHGAHQPYGIRNRPLLEAEHLHSAFTALRGLDAFREQYMVLDFATNEFLDDLHQGAKREIPAIRNVEKFRALLSPHVQRRLRAEPEIRAYALCPDPHYTTRTIEWDPQHLAHYLTVAIEFADWYRTRLESEDKRRSNLVAVLARLSAVIHAASIPHVSRENVPGIYTPLTSKQRYLLIRLEKLTRDGIKSIVFAHSPKLVARIAGKLAARGLDCVQFHGERNIAERTHELDARFRAGDTPILLSTYVGQSGLNIPEAGAVIFYNRNWSGRAEAQAIARTQRPDQPRRVRVEYLNLAGSIDEYIAMLVHWKQTTAQCGLDWGDGIAQGEVFHALDEILERFCRDTLSMPSYDVLKTYKSLGALPLTGASTQCPLTP